MFLYYYIVNIIITNINFLIITVMTINNKKICILFYIRLNLVFFSFQTNYVYDIMELCVNRGAVTTALAGPFATSAMPRNASSHSAVEVSAEVHRGRGVILA